MKMEDNEYKPWLEMEKRKQLLCEKEIWKTQGTCQSGSEWFNWTMVSGGVWRSDKMVGRRRKLWDSWFDVVSSSGDGEVRKYLVLRVHVH